MAPECHVIFSSALSGPVPGLVLHPPIFRPESRSGRSPATPACLRAVVLTHIPPLCNLFPHLSASCASIEVTHRARRRIPMRFFSGKRGGRNPRNFSCSGKGRADGLVRGDRSEHRG